MKYSENFPFIYMYDEFKTSKASMMSSIQFLCSHNLLNIIEKWRLLSIIFVFRKVILELMVKPFKDN
jgi:hypothetical protein